MPVVPSVPEALRGRVFRGSSAVPSGLLPPDQLRGASWRRLLPDVYAHRDVPVTHALRARTAAGPLLPRAVVTGRSAAVLRDVPLAGDDEDVELTLPPRRWSPERVCAGRGLGKRRDHDRCRIAGRATASRCA